MDTKGQVVLVAGASSGIGNACATFLAKRGFRVYGTSRDPSRRERKADEFFESLKLDLRDQGAALAAVETVLQRENKLDAVVCSAGYGLSGSVEDSSAEEAAALLDTDYLGPVRLLRAVLPAMRKQGSGRIIGVVPLGARRPLPFQAHYAAASRALVAMLDSLRAELLPFGIGVSIVESLPARTQFTQSRVTAAAATENSPYHDRYEAVMARVLGVESLALNPLEVAKTVHKAISVVRPKDSYVSPGLAKRLYRRLRPGKGVY
jgi:NAD(P)-dependent dehydrogenase (short-subunit alcohol dehydrogenase family)